MSSTPVLRKKGSRDSLASRDAKQAEEILLGQSGQFYTRSDEVVAAGQIARDLNFRPPTTRAGAKHLFDRLFPSLSSEYDYGIINK